MIDCQMSNADEIKQKPEIALEIEISRLNFKAFDELLYTRRTLLNV